MVEKFNSYTGKFEEVQEGGPGSGRYPAGSGDETSDSGRVSMLSNMNPHTSAEIKNRNIKARVSVGDTITAHGEHFIVTDVGHSSPGGILTVKPLGLNVDYSHSAVMHIHPDDITNISTPEDRAAWQEKRAAGAVKFMGHSKDVYSNTQPLKMCLEIWDSFKKCFVREGGPGSGRYPAGSGGDAKSQARRGYSAFTQSGFNGASISLHGDAPTTGYMVTGGKDREDVITLDTKDRGAMLAKFKEFAAKNTDKMKEGMYLGAWSDKGQLFFDTSANIVSKSDVAKICLSAGDKAYFDVKACRSIDAVTGEYI